MITYVSEYWNANDEDNACVSVECKMCFYERDLKHVIDQLNLQILICFIYLQIM